jgi:hypothetical protein
MITITICTIIFLLGAVIGEYTHTYTFAEYITNFIDIAKFALAGVAATTILAIITQKA